MDQDWPSLDMSGPRAAFYRALRPLGKNIYFERAGKDIVELDEIKSRLREPLKLMGIDRIVIVRFWFDLERGLGGFSTGYWELKIR
ncbi:MAG: hypothetical protein MN733_38475 [Nitrososphaera sp.]|nr:hypothetical protein [Nitrososphaera sp.]